MTLNFGLETSTAKLPRIFTKILKESVSEANENKLTTEKAFNHLGIEGDHELDDYKKPALYPLVPERCMYVSQTLYT